MSMRRDRDDKVYKCRCSLSLMIRLNIAMYHVQKTDQKQRRQRSSWNYVNVYQFVYCHATRIHETLSLIFDRRRRRDHLLLDVY